MGVEVGATVAVGAGVGGTGVSVAEGRAVRIGVSAGTVVAVGKVAIAVGVSTAVGSGVDRTSGVTVTVGAGIGVGAVFCPPQAAITRITAPKMTDTVQSFNLLTRCACETPEAAIILSGRCRALTAAYSPEGFRASTKYLLGQRVGKQGDDFNGKQRPETHWLPHVETT